MMLNVEFSEKTKKIISIYLPLAFGAGTFKPVRVTQLNLFRRSCAMTTAVQLPANCERYKLSGK